MKKEKLIVLTAIFLFCCGAAWGQKDVSDVYTMDVIVAANNISRESTSMIFLRNSFGGSYAEIVSFNGTMAGWRGFESTGDAVSRTHRGVIIPSGSSVMTISRISSSGERDNQTLVYDFRPGGFYEIYFYISLSQGAGFNVNDLSDDINWSHEKAQMEQVVSLHLEDGLLGAINRATQTIMDSPNLRRADSNHNIAVFGLTAQDRDFAQYVQEEVETILHNNGYFIFDRVSLDRILDEQRFQLGGDVNDDTAVSIGKLAGAQMIVTGSIISLEGRRFLRLRVVDAETGRLLATASEAL